MAMGPVFVDPQKQNDPKNTGANVEVHQVFVHDLPFLNGRTANIKNKTAINNPDKKVFQENVDPGANTPITNEPNMILAPSAKKLEKTSICLSVSTIKAYHGTRGTATEKMLRKINGNRVLNFLNTGNVGIGSTAPQSLVTIGGGGHLGATGTAPTVANNDCGSTAQGTITAGSTNRTLSTPGVDKVSGQGAVKRVFIGRYIRLCL